MPRAGWARPETDQRLSDHLSIGILTRTFPPGLVDEVICATGRAEQRQRLLSARVVLYYVLAMALFAESSYEEAMRHLLEGLSWQTGWSAPWQVPTKAAIFKSRIRLGVEPLAELYRRVVRPLAVQNMTDAWYRDWRLVTLEEMCLSVPDTAANLAALDQQESLGRDKTALPLFRIVGLTESATHVVVDVAMGPAAAPAKTLAPGVLRSLSQGMLCLADAQVVDLNMWEAGRAGGAELLWPLSDADGLTLIRQLGDGSHLANLHLGTGAHQAAPTTVRVIGLRLSASSQGECGGASPFVTTILDPDMAPAHELAALCLRRSALDATFRDLRTHQRSPRIVLRSKSPEGVQQEIYGLLLVHFAIRSFLGEPVAASQLVDTVAGPVAASG
jgi:hypothetical protein